ncbi:MAG TPA: hypothetical protein DIU15_10250 [Deltaproteobacteria bacterium]|nr:hypothetical protein [Deltaproteobacteria bacterium]HCP46415.1 hypothetical protein [Deltaproteobacteria bacterium]
MIFHIARREFLHYLRSPGAYFVGAGLLFIGGVFFSLVIDSYTRFAAQGAMYGQDPLSISQGIIEPLASTLGLLLVLFLPTLTMRALAEEQKSGSMALLLSAPISSTEVVLGKWLGLMSYLGCLLGLGMAYVPAMLFVFGDPPLAPLLSAYLGVALLCAVGAAVGIMTSSLTSNQVVAAVSSWTLLLGLWILSFLESLDGWMGSLGTHIGLIVHYESFSQGLVRSNDLAYFAVVTAICLFVAQQRVESQRWR